MLSKTALLPLLRTTAANEVSEAAWDAVPRVFTAADRAELQVAAKDLFEEAAKAAAAKTAPPRLYPRAKSTIEALR